MKHGCETCKYAGTLEGKVAHCSIFKKIYRLPHACERWEQLQKSGETPRNV